MQSSCFSWMQRVASCWETVHYQSRRLCLRATSPRHPWEGILCAARISRNGTKYLDECCLARSVEQTLAAQETGGMALWLLSCRLPGQVGQQPQRSCASLGRQHL